MSPSKLVDLHRRADFAFPTPSPCRLFAHGHRADLERFASSPVGSAAAEREAPMVGMPHLAVSLVDSVRRRRGSPGRVKEDLTILRDLRALRKEAPPLEATLDAAAEELLFTSVPKAARHRLVLSDGVANG